MSHRADLRAAKEGAESLGMWMETRHNHGQKAPIQKWKIPPKEKGFFTVYAMNLVLESDGFPALLEQNALDVKAFTAMLHRLGAEKTSSFVKSTLAALRKNTVGNPNKFSTEYYRLFARDELWMKLVQYVGERIFMGYCLKAQAIADSGGNIFDPKQWKGDLPKL
jgi:hypothetical protein